MIGKGCVYKQLANWDDSIDTIFVDDTYYRNLNPLNRAAFYLHESLYKVLRRRNPAVANSDVIRRIVAELLSANAEVSVPDQFLTQGDLLPNLSAEAGFTQVPGSQDPRSENPRVILNLGVLSEDELLSNLPTVRFSASLNPTVQQGVYAIGRPRVGCDSLSYPTTSPFVDAPLACTQFNVVIYTANSDVVYTLKRNYFSADFTISGSPKHFDTEVHDGVDYRTVTLTYLVP